MYLRLFEGLLLVFLAYVIISQILLPAARGTVLLPWLRREKKLHGEIAEANQAIRERELQEARDRLAEEAWGAGPGLTAEVPPTPAAAPAPTNPSSKETK